MRFFSYFTLSIGIGIVIKSDYYLIVENPSHTELQLNYCAFRDCVYRAWSHQMRLYDRQNDCSVLYYYCLLIRCLRIHPEHFVYRQRILSCE